MPTRLVAPPVRAGSWKGLRARSGNVTAKSKWNRWNAVRSRRCGSGRPSARWGRAGCVVAVGICAAGIGSGVWCDIGRRPVERRPWTGPTERCQGRPHPHAPGTFAPVDHRHMRSTPTRRVASHGTVGYAPAPPTRSSTWPTSAKSSGGLSRPAAGTGARCAPPEGTASRTVSRRRHISPPDDGRRVDATGAGTTADPGHARAPARGPSATTAGMPDVPVTGSP